jgi:hypothetical protein
MRCVVQFNFPQERRICHGPTPFQPVNLRMTLIFFCTTQFFIIMGWPTWFKFKSDCSAPMFGESDSLFIVVCKCYCCSWRGQVDDSVEMSDPSISVNVVIVAIFVISSIVAIAFALVAVPIALFLTCHPCCHCHCPWCSCSFCCPPPLLPLPSPLDALILALFVAHHPHCRWHCPCFRHQ